MAKKVTMSELARLAKVDISTVSRALNDSPLVKPHTKEAILKIADEIGYTVNIAARNLRKQSSEAIGIVIPLAPGSEQTISDPFFLEMVGSVSNAASEHGYDLIVSVPKDEMVIAERRLLRSGRADGLIVIGQAGRSERLNAMSATNSKIVVWGGADGEPSYTLVGSDNVKGGKLATSHLLKLGRKRILFLGDIDLPEVALRYKGLIQAHNEAGTAYDPNAILKLNFGGQSAFDAVVVYIESGQDFDAVFAASDVLAMAAIHALRSKNKSIPEDVSVVGYDNIGQAAMSTPSLTTINQNIAQGGQLMVDLLLKKIKGKKASSQFTTTELIVRGSCGAG
ncbi:LacI family DNA-binding transcriptional regulator [Fretibacter rubidus]|uniref:LacI family DNA-binding transcriptional regulator n=1 Tax=Fretibacter rubidus TaxID=570162 RepID=UPI00352A78DC